MLGVGPRLEEGENKGFAGSNVDSRFRRTWKLTVSFKTLSVTYHPGPELTALEVGFAGGGYRRM